MEPENRLDEVREDFEKNYELIAEQYVFNNERCNDPAVWALLRRRDDYTLVLYKIDYELIEKTAEKPHNNQYRGLYKAEVKCEDYSLEQIMKFLFGIFLSYNEAIKWNKF